MLSTSGGPGGGRPPWLDPGLGQNIGQIGNLTNPGLGQNTGQVGNLTNPGLDQNAEREEWFEVCRLNKIRYPIGSDLTDYTSRDLKESDLLYQRNLRTCRCNKSSRIVTLGTKIIPNFSDPDFNLTIDSMIDFIDKNKNKNFENCGPTQLQYGMIKYLISKEGVTEYNIYKGRIGWSNISCDDQLRTILVNKRR
jgi:hypothetical protein